jgi:hypothetical protein
MVVKRQGREGNHSRLSSAEVKNGIGVRGWREYKEVKNGIKDRWNVSGVGQSAASVYLIFRSAEH